MFPFIAITAVLTVPGYLLLGKQLPALEKLSDDHCVTIADVQLILNPIWNLFYYYLICEKMAIRHKNMLNFHFFVFLSMSWLRRLALKNPAWSIFGLFVGLILAAQKHWIVPLYYCNGYTDLPFALLMAVSILYFITTIQNGYRAYRLRNIFLFWLFLPLVCQNKYDLDSKRTQVTRP